MARYYLVQYDGSLGVWKPPAEWQAHHDAIAATGSSGCMTQREWDESLGVAMIETCDCCRIDAEWAMECLGRPIDLARAKRSMTETRIAQTRVGNG